MITKDWVVGFIEGEGSFFIGCNLERNNGLIKKIRFIPSFSIYLHYKDKLILETIKDFFGTGKIYKKKARIQQPNPQYVYHAYGNDAYKIRDFFIEQKMFSRKRKTLIYGLCVWIF